MTSIETIDEEPVQGLDDVPEPVSQMITLVCEYTIDSAKTSADGAATSTLERTKFQVPRDVAVQSVLVRTMVESTLDGPLDDIPILNVQPRHLEKVIAYMTHHYNNPAPKIVKPIKSKYMGDTKETDANGVETIVKGACKDPWDAKFTDVDQDEIYFLMMAADYMDIRPMLELLSCKIATLMYGKTVEEIRETFGIENDYTPEEYEKVKAENKWADDS